MAKKQKKNQIPLVMKVRKIKRMMDMYKPYGMIKEAEVSERKRDERLGLCEQALIKMFKENAPQAASNLTQILQAATNLAKNGKPPAAVPGHEQQMVDILSGLQAIEKSGGGVSPLKAAYDQVKAKNKGLSPDQAAIDAIAAIGRSATSPEVQQFKQAVSQVPDQNTANEVARLHGFYQQLMNRLRTAAQQQQQGQQDPQQQGQQAPQQGQQAPQQGQQAPQQRQQPAPVQARPVQPTRAPAPGVAGGPRRPM